MSVKHKIYKLGEVMEVWTAYGEKLAEYSITQDCIQFVPSENDEAQMCLLFVPQLVAFNDEGNVA